MLAWSLRRSGRVREIVAAPGNAGIAELARVEPAASERDLVTLATRERIDLAVIGPEAPLAAGLADELREAGVPTFGPGRDGARLEASKAYAKTFMNRHGIPTAAHAAFDALEPALAYLHDTDAPLVVKDSSLAAGKGVTVAEDDAEAERALRSLFERERSEVVLEERLSGRELSVMLLTDGETALELPFAQDHKRLGVNDTGPMTGGMGAVAPAPLPDAVARERLRRELIDPVLEGIRRDGIDFRGALFLGVMWTDAGPKLLEINVRLGDPEAQTVLPLLRTDLVELLEAVDARRLHGIEPEWEPGAAATVVMAAPGYPGDYVKGVPLAVPADLDEGVQVFHAGTRREEGSLVTSGGRVLSVTARGADADEALTRAYGTVARIDFPGAVVRPDIGGRRR